MVCPECGGALVVWVEQPGNRLIFRCRVGHVYAAEDMLIVKEQRLEEALWAAVYAAEELAAFLDDLDTRLPALDDDDRRARMTRLLANARSLRSVISNDRSVKLNSPAE
jgi:hypothetical protein